MGRLLKDGLGRLNLKMGKTGWMIRTGLGISLALSAWFYAFLTAPILQGMHDSKYPGDLQMLSLAAVYALISIAIMPHYPCPENKKD